MGPCIRRSPWALMEAVATTCSGSGRVVSVGGSVVSVRTEPEHEATVQAILDDPATASKTYDSPMVGAMPLPVMINNFYTADVFMHTWDLARATGQDDRLDEAGARATLEGMEPIEEMLRG